MQTRFSEARLRDPDVADADRILRACVHCGFCAPACPTYRLTGDELDGPRGRIWQIRDLLESDGPPPAETVRHLDRCLGCLNCMPACPSGVDYRHLADIARERIEHARPRSASRRLIRALLAGTLSHSGRARIALTLGRALGWLAPLLPGTAGEALRLARDNPAPAAPGPAPGIYGPTAERRGRVALIAGCVQATLAPGINEALIRLLNRAGVEVVVLADAACCGAIDHHLGRVEAARAHGRRVIDAVLGERDREGFDAVIQTAAGCGTLMKDYPTLFARAPEADRARLVAGLTRDASEYLVGLDLWFREDAPALTVAWQAPCSLTNGQGVTAPPVDLLRRAGFAVVSLDDGGMCCGSAGVYNVLEPEMAARLGAAKAAALSGLGAAAVISANIGCLSQLRPRLQVPVLHLVEALDWASDPTRTQALGAKIGYSGKKSERV